MTTGIHHRDDGVLLRTALTNVTGSMRRSGLEDGARPAEERLREQIEAPRLAQRRGDDEKRRDRDHALVREAGESLLSAREYRRSGGP
jgi:hypothetical protein